MTPDPVHHSACGLIEGIPNCRELIDGIVAEAGRVVQYVQTRVQGAAG